MLLRPKMICGYLYAVNVKIIMDIHEVWIWIINLTIVIIIIFRIIKYIKSNQHFSQGQTHANNG